MSYPTGIHLAVQQDPATAVVDESNGPGRARSDSIRGSEFRGTVLLLDDQGAPTAEALWTRPTDAGADEALESLRRVRLEPWHLDNRGRRVAAVTAADSRRPVRSLIPDQRTAD